ncbi:MAG: hybrid sensor histidine kinase/response regulator [Xanthomonadales bacterium]|jgi:signal transduction histidine kinase/ActR/RegA family two-component response regulator|nr:hybrid sensor histidine kinase/response regulator [Xanthomonadales bacterium]
MRTIALTQYLAKARCDWLILLLFGCWVLRAGAEIPMLPVEREALREPGRVLAELPGLRDAAQGNPRQLALLSLAEANACRVIANWECQKAAGARARAEARIVGDPILEGRGLIADARGRIALSDFYSGERLLAEAETLLSGTQSSDLLADVQLGYSSLSHRLGKHQVAADYAARGLATLGPQGDPGMRVRLLRNLARANAALERWEIALNALRDARETVVRLQDPKLRAEIALEAARLANQQGDIQAQQDAAREVLTLAKQLRNSQLEGLGLELLGNLSAQQQDFPAARQHYRVAAESFRALNLGRDELRVIDLYLQIALDQPDLSSWVVRRLQLESSVGDLERARAAEGFEERLRYAQQELDYVKLQSEAARLSAERSEAELRRRNSLLIGTLGVLILIIVAALALLQQRANRKLREALHARQQAMVQTSHEMRNSLVAIRGLSERLSQQSLPSAFGEMLHTIVRGADHLAALAQDLLDRGRLEAGQLRLILRPTRLQTLVQQVHRMHQSLAREKGLSLELDAPLNDLPVVHADPTRLEQILTNLLGNALKFTDQGLVQLSVRCVAPPSGQIRAVFSVTDSGPGIAEAEIPRLFRPFSQTSLGRQHSAGAGLGLSISHDLVRLMGGQLQVENVKPQGCRFHFELEFPPAPDLHADAEIIEHVSTSDPTLSVAVIDDDPIILMIYEGMLTHLGVQPKLFASVDEALAEQFFTNVDLLLLDYELSGGSGIEQLMRIRESGSSTLRIVVVSGHSAPGTLPNGVDEWVQKPASAHRLAMILAATRRSRHRPAALT